ncbi:MAG: hypothetical protein Q7S00_00500, partial [bacterium]|nr:hypothetical protein [bacterium]
SLRREIEYLNLPIQPVEKRCANLPRSVDFSLQELLFSPDLQRIRYDFSRQFPDAHGELILRVHLPKTGEINQFYYVELLEGNPPLQGISPEDRAVLEARIRKTKIFEQGISAEAIVQPYLQKTLFAGPEACFTDLSIRF